MGWSLRSGAHVGHSVIGNGAGGVCRVREDARWPEIPEPPQGRRTPSGGRIRSGY